MKLESYSTALISDDQLWQRSREGDREAFGQIVERYQSLIASLAYSGCGDFAGSQDVAQETFVTAWKRLGELREPAKLRAWLCGIARHLASNARRREWRRGGVSASIEVAEEMASAEGDPGSQAVTREEELLLWNVVGAMPETYREPLVLFYREQQSVSQVAEQLELSEDAVKQRLSRGRNLLRDEMAVRVESALSRTRPGPAFKVAVLAALPATALPASAAATAATGTALGNSTAAAKGALAGLGLIPIVGPAIGLIIGWMSSRLVGLTARSKEEREYLSRHALRIVFFCFAMSAGLALTLVLGRGWFRESPVWMMGGILVWLTVLLGGIIRTASRMDPVVREIRARTGTDDAVYEKRLAAHGLKMQGARRYESKWRLLGLPLLCFASGGMDTGSFRARAAKGWIAVGDVAISPLLALGGVAIGPIAIGGISVGILSLGPGLSLGVLAMGSVAVGWWALGASAVGWEAAAGGLALAHEFAVGGIARAAEANTALAKEWFRSQWWIGMAWFLLRQSVWLVVLSILIPVAMVLRRAWQLRKVAR